MLTNGQIITLVYERAMFDINGRPSKHIKVTCDFMRQHGNRIEKQFRDVDKAVVFYNSLILEKGVVKSLSSNGTISLLLLKQYR